MKLIDSYTLRIPREPKFEPCLHPGSCGGRMVIQEPWIYNVQVDYDEFKASFHLKKWTQDGDSASCESSPIEKYESPMVQDENYDSSIWAKRLFGAFSLYASHKISGNKKVIDFGCFDSRFTREVLPSFLGQDSYYTGIDNDSRALSIARKHSTESEHHFYVERDMVQTGIVAGRADLVTANNSLAYLPWPKLGVREMGRVAKSGGLLFIVDNYLAPDDVKRWMHESGFHNLQTHKIGWNKEPDLVSIVYTGIRD